MEEVHYVFSDEMNYGTRTGEKAVAQFASLSAPKGRHSKQTAKLKQAILQAGSDNAERQLRNRRLLGEDAADVPLPITPPESAEEAEEPAEEDADDGSWILEMIARSPVDLGEFYAQSRILLSQKGIVLLDGTTPMTTTLLDDMSGKDFEGIVSLYCVSFILPS